MHLFLFFLNLFFATPVDNDIDKRIKAARRGNDAAFDMLFRRYRNYLYVQVRDELSRRCAQAINEDIEDICQESWVIVHRSIHKYRGGVHGFGGWIRQIGLNVAKNWIRSRERDKTRVQHYGLRQAHIKQGEDGLDSLYQVAVELLPEKSVNIFKMRFEGYTLGEIAKANEVTKQTAQRLINEAIRVVRAELGSGSKE